MQIGLLEIQILLFLSVFAGEPEVVQLVRKLGMAFPDREITLQTKSNFQIIRGLKEFYEACSQGLPNVRVSTESVYDSFVQSQYGISIRLPWLRPSSLECICSH